MKSPKRHSEHEIRMLAQQEERHATADEKTPRGGAKFPTQNEANGEYSETVGEYPNTGCKIRPTHVNQHGGHEYRDNE